MNADRELHDIQGIVLDAVGTLIEPRPSVSRAYADAARRQGVDLDVKEVKARFLRHFSADELDESSGLLATDDAVERRRWRRIVAGCLPETPDLDLAFRELWSHFGDPTSWAVFPDVPGALASLREDGFRLCIASNFDSRLRGVLAGLQGLGNWRDPLVISSEVGHRKPHRAFYEAACLAMNLPPSRILCIGDDPENDHRGPIRAGLRAVLIERRGASPSVENAASGLDEVAKWLREARQSNG